MGRHLHLANSVSKKMSPKNTIPHIWTVVTDNKAGQTILK
jgi:hypothetical protein